MTDVDAPQKTLRQGAFSRLSAVAGELSRSQIPKIATTLCLVVTSLLTVLVPELFVWVVAGWTLIMPVVLVKGGPAYTRTVVRGFVIVFLAEGLILEQPSWILVGGVFVVGSTFTIVFIGRVISENDRLAAFVEKSSIAMVVLRFGNVEDPLSMRVVEVNREAVKLYGVPREVMIGGEPTEQDLANTGLELIEALQSAAGGAAVPRMTLSSQVPSGEKRTSEIDFISIGPSTVGMTIKDITQQVEAARILEHQALHDALTGLPNRLLLYKRLDESIAAASESGERTALLLMDLNQFKEINDSLGHHHGDQLLIEIGGRLEATIRPADTAARLGGDEFAVVLAGDVSPEGGAQLAKRIAARFAEPVEIDGIEIQVSVSIGVAVYPQHGADGETLAQHADVAMYKAKSTGTGVAVYSEELATGSVKRLTLLNDLRSALNRDELVLHYQPRLDLQTNTLVDVEALVRWNHPVQGLLPPNEFIPLAEVSGLIQPLTHYVLRTATADVSALTVDGSPLGVAVNLSVRNLHDGALLDVIADCLHTNHLASDRLRVELTETELIDDPDLAIAVLGRIRTLGIGVSIDDFGTGYSSFSYLRNLPITELKIDRTFVADMLDGEDTIVRSIIELAHNLGLNVVAEGVEHLEQVDRLRELGCDSAQGYYISYPLAIDDLKAFLVQRAAQPPVVPSSS